MNKKENIILDARIGNVIGHAAFDAVLENGHRFVAFFTGPDRRALEDLPSGTTVQVEFSPYDMSKGRILLQNPGLKDES